MESGWEYLYTSIVPKASREGYLKHSFHNTLRAEMGLLSGRSKRICKKNEYAYFLPMHDKE